MSCELMICLSLALFTWDSPQYKQRAYSLSDIEQNIEDHRRMIRMCGPLSAIRACALTGRKVDVGTTLAKYRCRHGQDSSRSQSALPGQYTQLGQDVPVDAGTLRREGIRVGEVVTLCRDLGLDARGIRMNERSLGKLPTPCILLLNEDHHCVVLESTAHQGPVRVWDPAELASKQIDAKLLRELWSGHVIVFASMPWSQRLIEIANVGAFVVTITVLAWSRRVAGKRK